MSREKVIMTAAAGAGLIGATIYATRATPTETQDKRNKAQQKRDLGLGGAGIGGNHMAGGTERGPPPGPGDGDPKRQVTTAESRDKLPSGAIGGGEGAGGSGARRTQLSFPGSSTLGSSGGENANTDKNPTRPKPAADAPASENSGWLNSMRSAVGGKSTASRKDEEGLHDTRGISKMGSETPSKRGPADASN
ncbi:hypothetical protein NOR_03556 [Metarhizium rileyi]|uniref:Uncharacterized protein n=1 Tax=Metarhizium rileyi (strain RCEF 4871) TaxID=1649241 RepID=A0A167F4X2_METRR|nr:hypothetical protein NOR_03556 [Metarhizium rileyi RCEF 4871]